MRRRPVVLSYGLGADSQAILEQWVAEPGSRVVNGQPFELSDLIVITAMTGDEFRTTRELVSQRTLPLMREHSIRFVQVAKSGPSTRDGITILDDSTQPQELHAEGDYKLSQELLEGVTIPASGGARKCSQKFKGWVLDQWIDANVDGPYDHVIGFEANEQNRAKRDTKATAKNENRLPAYPLIDWGWDRQACLDRIAELSGLNWRKSACVFCPFSQGCAGVTERFAQEEDAAADALVMERIALRFNPRMLLYKTKSLESVLEAAELQRVQDLADRKMSDQPWALYRLQRVGTPNARGTAQIVRQVTEVMTGTRQEVEAELDRRAAGRQVQDGRLDIVERPEDSATFYEESLVASPRTYRDKGASHAKRFQTALGKLSDLLGYDPAQEAQEREAETASGQAAEVNQESSQEEPETAQELGDLSDLHNLAEPGYMISKARGRNANPRPRRSNMAPNPETPRQGPTLKHGTRIYYGGNAHNHDGWGRIVDWEHGRYVVQFEDGRRMDLAPCQISETYSGTGADPFVTEDAYRAWERQERERRIREAMERTQDPQELIRLQLQLDVVLQETGRGGRVDGSGHPVGLFEQVDGTFDALTHSQSRVGFKTRKGAENWLADRGYRPDGKRFN